MSVSIFIRKSQFCSSFFFRDEISIIRKKCVLRAGVLALGFTSVIIATLLSVITLVLTEETLTPVNVFVLVSFNNMLTLCIGTYLGLALLEGYEAYASLGRIEEFLLLKNLRVISSDRSSQKETEIEAENPSEMKRNSSDCQKKTERSFHSWWITRSNVITCEKFGVQASGATRLLFFKISSFALRLVV